MNAIALMGKKLRMTQKFDNKGNVVACTVIEAEPNVIAQIKNQEKDGYNALQLGFKKVLGKTDDRKKKRIKKPRFGHFAKNKIEPRYRLFECRVDSIEGFDLGQEITISQFEQTAFVDVTGTSKGKGFQGPMKLHNFSGGPAAHGSGFHRSAGSTGTITQGCQKGDPRASRMGGDRVTVENLKVLSVDIEKNLMLVKGAIPGPNGSKVVIRPSRKKST